jgi:pimeloyl-ACP methyl ester carboxylesterase
MPSPDVEDIANALRLGDFSVIGISGGTPYALATLSRLGGRVRTATKALQRFANGLQTGRIP